MGAFGNRGSRGNRRRLVPRADLGGKRGNLATRGLRLESQVNHAARNHTGTGNDDGEQRHAHAGTPREPALAPGGSQRVFIAALHPGFLDRRRPGFSFLKLGFLELRLFTFARLAFFYIVYVLHAPFRIRFQLDNSCGEPD